MSTDRRAAPLDAVYEALADEIEGWASGLGTETAYTDPVLGDCESHDWAESLRRECDWGTRTAASLLTADGRIDQADDLKRRIDGLLVAAKGYEQRLEALADRRRVHIEGLVARYRQQFGEEDPDEHRLWRLCRGIQRVWTLRADDHSPQTPEAFAEAIDWAWFEEDGAKRRARAEVQRQANALIEHLRLLAELEVERSAAPSSAAQTPPETDRPSSSHVDEDDESFGVPEPDPYDSRAVRWVGKRLYLGKEGTQVRELFMLLARRPGVPHPLWEVQRAVDKMDTDRERDGEEAFNRSMNRIAKALSKLRRHLEENGLDDHVMIIKEGPRNNPFYTLISRFGTS